MAGLDRAGHAEVPVRAAGPDRVGRDRLHCFARYEKTEQLGQRVTPRPARAQPRPYRLSCRARAGNLCISTSRSGPSQLRRARKHVVNRHRNCRRERRPRPWRPCGPSFWREGAQHAQHQLQRAVQIRSGPGVDLRMLEAHCWEKSRIYEIVEVHDQFVIIELVMRVQTSDLNSKLYMESNCTRFLLRHWFSMQF